MRTPSYHISPAVPTRQSPRESAFCCTHLDTHPLPLYGRAGHLASQEVLRQSASPAAERATRRSWPKSELAHHGGHQNDYQHIVVSYAARYHSITVRAQRPTRIVTSRTRRSAHLARVLRRCSSWSMASWTSSQDSRACRGSGRGRCRGRCPPRRPTCFYSRPTSTDVTTLVRRTFPLCVSPSFAVLEVSLISASKGCDSGCWRVLSAPNTCHDGSALPTVWIASRGGQGPLRAGLRTCEYWMMFDEGDGRGMGGRSDGELTL